ncbi:MAG: CotH kinase family protein [Ignavibacteria bacterium]|nr:CotH kinase family protein [Ignavibacteria bacterium]
MKPLLFIFSLLILYSVTLRSQNQIIDSKENPGSFTSSNLPIVVIETNGQTIKNEPKIIADMGIIYKGEGVRNNLTDPQNNYKGKVAIEIRGSTSQAFFPKKQYALETRTSGGADTSVSLLGFPEENDWILYAPYTDKTFFRDVLTYWLSAKVGHYASRFKFCEMVLNGEYMGVFILLEKIKRDKNRVDVSKLTVTDNAGDSLTGGYILKIDKEDGSGNDGWRSLFPPYFEAWQKIYWQYHYPKPEDITPQQKVYIQKYIEDFETRLYNPDYADTLTGYPSLIDVPSFVDCFLLNEMCKNVDSYRLSTFMYKDKDSKNSKLVMGPVWDYNIAWGNANYYDASLVYGWHISYLSTNLNFLQTDQFQVPFWWKKIIADSNFQKKYAERWFQLRQNEFNLTNIYRFIDSLKTLTSEAQPRNYQRWPILGTWVWPNYYVGQTYDDEVTYFKNWIKDRLGWMDEELHNIIKVKEPDPKIPTSFELFQNYPNPFNPGTVISWQCAVGSHVTLKVFDVLGNEVATLVNEVKQPGIYETKFQSAVGNRQLASGISAKGGYPSGVYFYQLRSGNIVLTKKMILVR